MYDAVLFDLDGTLIDTESLSMAAGLQALAAQQLTAGQLASQWAAPDADVGRIKGEVLRLGGYGDAARNALIAPYVRGERDPRPQEANLFDLQAKYAER